jgi:hypothetical protein
MNKEIITANSLKTICWLNDKIIDWAEGGEVRYPNDQKKQLGYYHYGFRFDAAITSDDLQYAFIYEKLGTKGLLLKNDEILREINRSYYFANVYEYPAAFATIDNVTYLVHCPVNYCQLDFENVETGELVTNIPERKSSDTFHSRLEVSPDNTWLMSKGWRWHPVDAVEVFNIKECLNNPLLLDAAHLSPDIDVEISTASFINDNTILIGTGDEVFDDEIDGLPIRHIAIWNLTPNKINSTVKVQAEFGNLYAINEQYAWDTFKFPKIIDINTGESVDKDETIDSGEQRSSIVLNDDAGLSIFNPNTKQLAVRNGEKIYVLTPDSSFLK